jgi:hypothetical protein
VVLGQTGDQSILVEFPTGTPGHHWGRKETFQTIDLVWLWSSLHCSENRTHHTYLEHIWKSFKLKIMGNENLGKPPEKTVKGTERLRLLLTQQWML